MRRRARAPQPAASGRLCGGMAAVRAATARRASVGTYTTSLHVEGDAPYAARGRFVLRNSVSRALTVVLVFALAGVCAAACAGGAYAATQTSSSAYPGGEGASTSISSGIGGGGGSMAGSFAAPSASPQDADADLAP